MGVTARESESHELAARQFGFLSAIGDIAQDTAKSGAKVAGGAGRSRLSMAKGEAKTEKKNLKHQQPVGQVLMGGFATRDLEVPELAARQFGFLSAIGDIAQDTAKSGAKVAGGAGRSRLPMAKGEAKTEKKNLKHQQPVGQVLMGGFATRELYGMSERDYENGMIYV